MSQLGREEYDDAPDKTQVIGEGMMVIEVTNVEASKVYIQMKTTL